MNRPMLVMRRPGLTLRHRRVRRRPVALVLRRPPRARAAAPRPVIRAADRVSVTLAPRFTLVLQHFVGNAAVVRQLVHETAVALGAPADAANARTARTPRLAWPYAAAAPTLSRPAARHGGAFGVLRPPGRAVPGEPALVVTPAARSGTSIDVGPGPGRLGSTTKARRPRPTGPAREATAPGRRSGQQLVLSGGLHEPRRMTSSPPGSRADRPAHRNLALRSRGHAVAGRARSEPRAGGPAPLRWSGTRHAPEDVPLSGRSRPRVDLTLSGSAPSGPRRGSRVTPVPTVFRQDQPTQPAPAPAPAPVPALAAAQPAIDLDRLDRELWRRFEKRARTERERHGRA